MICCFWGKLWQNSWTQQEQTDSSGVLELAAQTAKPLGTKGLFDWSRQKQTNLRSVESIWMICLLRWSSSKQTSVPVPYWGWLWWPLIIWYYYVNIYIYTNRMEEADSYIRKLFARDQHDQRTTNEQPLLADQNGAYRLIVAVRSMTEQILALVPDLFFACLEVKQRRRDR